MLLNFSNHPSTSWSEEQINETIVQYDSVQDLPFPSIDPKASVDQIEHLAQKFEMKIRQIRPTAVHIMGEMTFTYKLVNRLKAAGITCIASTTQRTSKEDINGIKISSFKFLQFREY